MSKPIKMTFQEFEQFLDSCPAAVEALGPKFKRGRAFGQALDEWAEQNDAFAAPEQRSEPAPEEPLPLANEGPETYMSEWAWGARPDRTVYYLRSLGEKAARDALVQAGCNRIGAPTGFISEEDLLKKFALAGLTVAGKLTDSDRP